MYEPAEDSFLLKKEVETFCMNNEPKLVIDMGTGLGIQAIAAAIFSQKVLAVDIEKVPDDVFKGTSIEFIQSNLFEKVPKEYLGLTNLIIFNAPYLPLGEDDYDATELYGGKNGVDLTIEFLMQAKKFLAKNGFILFVASSHADIDLLNKKLEEFGYKFSVVAKKHIFFEDIMIYKAHLK